MQENINKKKTLVYSVVLYGVELWALKKIDGRQIEAFEMTCWRKLLTFFGQNKFFFLFTILRRKMNFHLILSWNHVTAKTEGKKNESLQRKHAARPTLFALPPVLFDKLKHSKHVRVASIPAHPGMFSWSSLFLGPRKTNQTRTNTIRV